MTMIPLPAAIAAHLRPNATLLVLPVEPQFRTLWGQGVRRDGTYSVHVDIPTPDGWLWIPCPLTPGETYYLREPWHLGTGDGVKCGINVQVKHDPWLYEVPTEHREATYRIARKIGYGGRWQPARTMKPWMTLNHYRVATVECRRVRSVTEAECIAAGFKAEQLYRVDYSPARNEFRFAFTATHGAAAWDEDAWSWFITRESSERE